MSWAYPVLAVWDGGLQLRAQSHF